MFVARPRPGVAAFSVRIEMSEPIDKLWKDTWKGWSASNSISRYSWASLTLIREHVELEERIFKALTNENPFLVANCLVALEAMKSTRLSTLPPEIFKRPERLTVINGSFAQDYTLGRLAREISDKFELGGSANRSQPVGPRTNRTSPGAGSGG
jgi:hypothetical protein